MKKRRKSPGRPKIRVRDVSFRDIEAMSSARDTEFKREVRHAMTGQVKSPLDDLIDQEEELEEQKREIQQKRRFNRIVKYAGLTPKQLACYKLSRSKRNPTLARIAKKLGISVSSAWSRLERAEKKIERVLIRFLEGKRIDKLITYEFYRPVLKHVFHLYYERAWPPKKIAKALRRNLSSVYRNIQRLKWLAHGYSPKEAAQAEIFEIGGKKIAVSIQKPSKKPRYWS